MTVADQNAGLQAVVRTLKGPVAEVFRKLLPPLRALSAEEVYSLAMANGDLLVGCLQIFHHRRDAFASLLVDARGRRVNDDFVRLRCGYTLHEIIAMVTRTHAKRHFQAALGGDANDPSTPAGRMYAAIREYLIHEWQVPLVPHYAPLPVETVLAMGPALLDVKRADKLDELSGVAPGAIAAARAVASHQATHPVPARAPAPAPAAPRATTPSPPPAPAPAPSPPPTPTPAPVRMAPPPPPPPPVQEPPPRIEPQAPPPPPPPQQAARRPAQPPRFEGTPQEEFWYQTLDDRQVRSALDLRDDDEMLTLVAALAHLGEPAHAGFLAPLRLSMPQAAVALAVAWRTMGETAFKAVFGSPGDAREIGALTQRLDAQNVGSRTDLRTLMRSMEANLRIKQLNRARA